MDEPLTHLDSTGRASVGKLLRKICNEDTLALSTILVILQDIAAEEIEECFDQVDEVVKSGGESYIILDANMENVDEYQWNFSSITAPPSLGVILILIGTQDISLIRV